MEKSMAAEPSQGLDSQLATLRAGAKTMREQRSSWFEHIFHPGRSARRQEDFSTAVVETLTQIIASIRNATATVAEKEREISELRSAIDGLREQHERLGSVSGDAIQSLTDRAAEMHQQIAQLAHDHAKQIEQVIAHQGDLGNELRERIQQVLDEQRVAIRQVSLKASEDAILSDRARRATELKLEELAKRVPPPPA
jgi:methyl-accepting chemotaxis protein